ncbi:hypothetical protein G7072_11640 [Nocardioides sp. HDW12B]|uniref:hypothetical protein n=1 Tax=Nocardioides sp. HDW12B TaxID=2714939 RepID=UPI00140A3DA4|nr:hypothetical protein [Nocardioides sp. HDW12B]QIK66910.1 hypothetical protein G7072_11640 [Nocardioides sp. HDW12B]
MTARPPTDHQLDHELDQHLRRTLSAVADTVRDEPADRPAVTPLRPRRRRRLVLGAAAAAVAVPVAAAAVVGLGPEYVDRIPPADPIISGSIDGERYWVVDGPDVPRCAGRPSGIMTLAEQDNVVGQEWNGFGYVLGPPTPDGCAPRTVDASPDETYVSDGGQSVGDGMLWAGALHPDVDQVRVSLDEAEPFDADTFTHEGATYFTVEVPADTAVFTVEYVVDGQVVTPPAGETATHTLG